MFWLSPGLGFIGFGIPVGSPDLMFHAFWLSGGLGFRWFGKFWLSPGLGFICFGFPGA